VSEATDVHIVSVAEMRTLEAAAFAAGISEAALQQRAADAIAAEVLPMVEFGQRVAVLVGHGNNGRDGALAGIRLAARSVGVDLVLAPRHTVTDAELLRLRSLGARVLPWDRGREAVGGAAVALDAIAGIGAHGALREPLAAMARLLDGCAAHVVAVDGPSGIDADSGDVPGDAVWADTTVTLGAIKQGLLRFPAAERVGRLVVRDIGIPTEAEAGLAYRCLTAADVHPPARPLGAHKYRFGRVLVVAGSDQYLGAAVLCTGAALRSGAGLVTVASTSKVQQAIASRLPEATFLGDELRIEADPHAATEQVSAALETHSTLVLGPGLGRSSATTAFVAGVLRSRKPDAPVVIDADGLYALSEIPQWQAHMSANVVLTPHAGELQRLVGSATPSDAAPWQQARELAQQWRCMLVAKGPFTSVADGEGRTDVWPHANPALATGGTGDVLAGLCGGLIAQGSAPGDAARLAVVVHALVAQRIVGSRGWRTLLASDMLDELPSVLAAATQRR
jgi:NAD(P)H-hydrate epimerase